MSFIKSSIFFLDEYYWLDKEDPNSSNCRLIHKRGNELPTDGLYQLGSHASEIVKLVLTPESELQGKTIEEWFSPRIFETNFLDLLVNDVCF